MTSETLTKEQLLVRIREGHNTFAALLRTIKPGDQLMKLGDWTAGEHVAHVASWEKLPLAVLRGESPVEAMGITQADWDADTDGINEALQRQNAGISFDEARSQFTQVHTTLIATIEACTEEELARPLGAGEEDTVSDLIASNTYGHYEEHAGWMRTALGR